MAGLVHQARPAALSTPSHKLALSPAAAFHQEQIQTLLAKLGVRRQARLDPMDYLVLAEDLAGYELADVEEGLELLKHRQEFEPSFPDLGMIEQAIEKVIRERRWAKAREERAAKAAAADEAEETHRREHPEDYEPVRNVWADVVERMKGRNDMPGSTPRSEPKPPVVHAITAAPNGDGGWWKQSCECGRRWDTYGKVEICPDVDSVGHRKQVTAGLAAFAASKVQPANTSCAPVADAR